MTTTTNKAVRITKAQKFAAIKALLSGETPSIEFTVDDAKTFIDGEVNLLTKKNTSTNKKQTKTQKENEGLREEIVEFLGTLTISDEYKGIGCTDLIKAKGWLGTYSVSKVARLLSQLKAEGRVESETVKGKPLFRLA